MQEDVVEDCKQRSAMTNDVVRAFVCAPIRNSSWFEILQQTYASLFERLEKKNNGLVPTLKIIFEKLHAKRERDIEESLRGYIYIERERARGLRED